MSERPHAPFLLTFPLEAVILDGIYILIAWLFIGRLTDFFTDNLLLGTAVALPFQWIALYFATCTVFRKEEEAPESWKRGIGGKIWWSSFFYVLLLGYTWLLPPVKALEAAAVINPKIREIGNILGFLLNGTLSFLAFHLADRTGRRERIHGNLPLRYLSAFVVMLFLVYFSALTLAAFRQLRHFVTPLQHTLLLLVGALSFLPVRLLLLLRPPFHILELVSFLLAFAVFLCNLFQAQ